MTTWKQLLTAGLLLCAFTACNSGKSDVQQGSATETEKGKEHKQGIAIAYINLDSLEANYEFFKNKKAEFEKNQASMEAEIQRLNKSLNNEVAAFQKKLQSGTLTQSEGEKLNNRLTKMQQNVETRSQNLSMELMKEQEKFNRELQARLDSFLNEYNADKKYDFILSHIKGTTILWANDSYDITDEVIRGLNERYRKSADAKKAEATKEPTE